MYNVALLLAGRRLIVSVASERQCPGVHIVAAVYDVDGVSLRIC